jgi:hypothetical protein
MTYLCALTFLYSVLRSYGHMPDNRWDIQGVSISCLNDIDTYVIHVLGHIHVSTIYMYLSQYIICVTMVFKRPSRS